MSETAEQVFIARIAEARELVERISEHIEDHLGVDPGSLHWGHAGDAGRVVELLRGVVEACGEP